jgi:glutamate 5-kinase
VIVVAKVGTSSITRDTGEIDEEAIGKFCAEVVTLRRAGHRVVMVTSGAIAAGLPALGLSAVRPRDAVTLQAASAVGQSRLMRVYDGALAKGGLIGGQVLLAPLDFMVRQQYLHARGTLDKLLELGVVPVINENDAVETAAARGERAFADNDRLAAILAALLGADLLVLLTDVAGLYERDPRRHPEARLLAEVADAAALGRVAAGVGSQAGLGRGGMRSKVEAATIAQKSGCATVIADGAEPGALSHLLAGEALGTFFPAGPRPDALDRWIACAARPHGALRLDAGAVAALVDGRASLLAAGVTGVDGRFEEGDVVELRGPEGRLVGRALLAMDDARCRQLAGAPKVTRVRRQYVVLAEGLPQAAGGAA